LIIVNCGLKKNSSAATTIFTKCWKPNNRYFFGSKKPLKHGSKLPLKQHPKLPLKNSSKIPLKQQKGVDEGLKSGGGAGFRTFERFRTWSHICCYWHPLPDCFRTMATLILKSVLQLSMFIAPPARLAHHQLVNDIVYSACSIFSTM